jgi:hypothetical protein
MLKSRWPEAGEVTGENGDKSEREREREIVMPLFCSGVGLVPRLFRCSGESSCAWRDILRSGRGGNNADILSGKRVSM